MAGRQAVPDRQGRVRTVLCDVREEVCLDPSVCRHTST